MKKSFQMLTSLDGFFEGPDRELDRHIVDEELFKSAIELLNSLDWKPVSKVLYLPDGKVSDKLYRSRY